MSYKFCNFVRLQPSEQTMPAAASAVGGNCVIFMQKPYYHIFTLDNGLRVVHCQTDSHVAYAGVVVGAGSRDESSDKSGLAHFVEHTVFKGTEHRTSRNINLRLESIGGELNAYTTKEETVIFANTPAGYTDRAFELLYDLIAYSNFPEAEVERERDVVIEEINSYLDNPADTAFDNYEDRIFAGSGLGHNILGNAESVRSMTPADCRAFVERVYRPANMTIYCADSSPAGRIEALAAKYFGRLHFEGSGIERRPPTAVEPFSATIDRNGHQAHTICGCRVFGRKDPRSHALFLLNNYLGGPGMSSRLNEELREKRGYVYTVDSSVSLMSDTGLWAVYFGSDVAMADRCVAMIRREVERLACRPLGDRRLERAKRQYIGQVMLASDNRESMAMSMGKSLAYYGEVHDVDWISERIRAVTASDVRDMACMLAENAFSRLTLY